MQLNSSTFQQFFIMKKSCIMKAETHKVSAKFVTQNIVYELTSPITSNVNNVVSNIDVNSFLQNPDIKPCSCRDSSFIDKYHSHILTGDLRIVKNSIRFKQKNTINFPGAKKVSQFQKILLFQHGVNRKLYQQNCCT